MPDQFIDRTSNLKTIENGIRNKFHWEWLEDKDCNVDYLTEYVRKLVNPDVEDIKFVINFDYPNCSEDYVHRIGRTARSSKTGTAYTLFTPGNVKQAPDLISVLKEANQVISPKLMQLAESSRSFLGKGRSRWGGRDRGGRDDSRGGGRGRDSRGNQGRSMPFSSSSSSSSGGRDQFGRDKPNTFSQSSKPSQGFNHSTSTNNSKPSGFSQTAAKPLNNSAFQQQPMPLMGGAAASNNSSMSGGNKMGNNFQQTNSMAPPPPQQGMMRSNFSAPQQTNNNSQRPPNMAAQPMYNHNMMVPQQQQQQQQQNQQQHGGWMQNMNQMRPPLPMGSAPPPPPPPHNQGY